MSHAWHRFVLKAGKLMVCTPPKSSCAGFLTYHKTVNAPALGEISLVDVVWRRQRCASD